MLLRKTFIAWLPLAFAISVLCGLGYTLVQQDLRQTAYDEPQRLAQDVTAKLVTNTPATALNMSQTVNISDSLSPYVIIYNASGQPIAGTGLLDTILPTPPTGVFAYAVTNGENRITWQPRPDVRSAIVVIAMSGNNSGYVLAGQSLLMTETHTEQLLMLTAFGWIVALIGSFFLEGFHQISLAKAQKN